MPWNSQGGGGGGPWGPPPGNGGQNPWGRPPGGGGGGPGTPDLEELVRRGQDRLKNLLPGGWGNRRGFILAGLAVVIIWLMVSVYRVQPDEQGVVLRFGAYNRTEQPGLHFILYPIETVYRPKVTQVKRIEVGFRSVGEGRRGDRDVADESLMLTGDENIIDIDFSVFWVIKDAQMYLFKIRDPEGTVKKAAESAMREVIGRTELQPALTEARQQIERQTRDVMQAMLDEYQSGIEITQLQLQRADPPTPVIDAFNDVQRARADRERLRNEAEAYRNDIIPRARGDAQRLVQEASAYRDQVVALAEGDADRFRKVLAGYRLAKEVLAQRLYLETMEEVLHGMRKVIVDDSIVGGQGVVPYLPLGDLSARPAPAAAAPAAPPAPPRPTTQGATP